MIILTGSLAYDYILNFKGKFTDHILPSKIHTINLSFLAEKLSKEKGGIAGNIGYNLALLGIKPIILGSLGQKDGREYVVHLKKSGIETKFIKLIENEFTASYIVVTDLLNNQIGAFYPGAMRFDRKRSLKEVSIPYGRANALLEGAYGEKNDLVIISSGDPLAMEKFIKECQENNWPYLFDPGKQLPHLSNEVLKLGISRSRILIANDYELALIKKRVSYLRYGIVRRLRSGKMILITTFGERGSVIETKNKIFKIKAAKPKEVVDPVGAGDAYLGGFLAGYIRGYDLKTCGQMGSVCAVYTVEKYGTQTHKFSQKEFIKRYKENYGEVLPF